MATHYSYNIEDSVQTLSVKSQRSRELWVSELAIPVQRSWKNTKKQKLFAERIRKLNTPYMIIKFVWIYYSTRWSWWFLILDFAGCQLPSAKHYTFRYGVLRLSTTPQNHARAPKTSTRENLWPLALRSGINRVEKSLPGSLRKDDESLQRT